MTKSNLSRDLLNVKVLPASKALWLYTTVPLTSTPNCFAPMFNRKLDRFMMNYGRSFETFQRNLNKLTSNVEHKNSCIRNNWLCVTCSNKVYSLIFVEEILYLIRMHTYRRCVLKWEKTVLVPFVARSWWSLYWPLESFWIQKHLDGHRDRSVRHFGRKILQENGNCFSIFVGSHRFRKVCLISEKSCMWSFTKLSFKNYQTYTSFPWALASLASLNTKPVGPCQWFY